MSKIQVFIIAIQVYFLFVSLYVSSYAITTKQHVSIIKHLKSKRFPLNKVDLIRCKISETDSSLKNDEVSVKNTNKLNSDIIKTVGWTFSALLFSGVLGYFQGFDATVEFCAGYLLEQCLSIDNLFVFLVLFEYFKVNDLAMKERVLGYGLWTAVVLRGIFIALGSIAVEQAKQVFLLFVIVLAVSSAKILFGGDDDDEDEQDLSENFVVKISKKLLQTTDKFDGDRFFTEVQGVRTATPLLLCLICIELSDIVFAFDSVPAVFGVTSNPLVVYSSNIFAIGGLRAVFNILSQAVSELRYLEKAVGLVLGVIAVKLACESVDVTLVTPVQSLLLVLGILGGGVAASLLLPLPASEEGDNAGEI